MERLGAALFHKQFVGMRLVCRPGFCEGSLSLVILAGASSL
jgi:hypothetical protein